MTEDESYQENLDYMRGQIESLKQILRVTIATMTDAQREFIYSAANEHAEKLAEQAQLINTDYSRARTEAAYNIANSVNNADDWVSDYKSK